MKEPDNPIDDEHTWSDSPSTDGMPDDPISAIGASATQLHEVYTAYVEAGFSMSQAVYLVGVILATGMRSAPPAT